MMGKKDKYGNWYLRLGPGTFTYIVNVYGKPSLLNRVVARMAGMKYIFIEEAHDTHGSTKDA